MADRALLAGYPDICYWSVQYNTWLTKLGSQCILHWQQMDWHYQGWVTNPLLRCQVYVQEIQCTLYLHAYLSIGGSIQYRCRLQKLSEAWGMFSEFNIWLKFYFLSSCCMQYIYIHIYILYHVISSMKWCSAFIIFSKIFKINILFCLSDCYCHIILDSVVTRVNQILCPLSNTAILQDIYRNLHNKVKVVSLPSNLFYGNPHTWRNGLYIETGPWLLANKHKYARWSSATASKLRNKNSPDCDTIIGIRTMIQ